MSPRSFSSGDPIADRRLAIARDHATAGDPVAAAELAEQALELAPDWAAGWFVLGEFREAAGETEGAIAAWERALALDREDRCGAVLRLARLGVRAAPAAPPPAHVRDLFDAYAPRFEASLVGALGYRIPERIAEALAALAPGRRFADALDLGCGTGLAARALKGRVARFEGVDLAPAMVAAARASGLYAALAVADVATDLAARPAATFDLVTAADLFCYLGEIGGVIGAVARVLRPGGLFAFSVEAAGAADTIVFRDSLRYAHGRAHVERLAAESGLAIVHLADVVVRRDRGADVAGFLVVAERRADGPEV